jgi:hypothetical protein
MIEVSGKDYHLEITSLLPKPHWNMQTGIQFNGQWYGLVDSTAIKDANETRYRFRLKKAEEGVFFRDTSFYSPDEVKKLYVEKRRRDLSTWVDTFAPFWGLLDEHDQKRLGELYAFDGLKFSKWTIIAIGVLSLANLIVSITNIAAGIGRSLDTCLLLLSIYFLVESIGRLQSLRSGKPSGSVLGIFVRPLASKLLSSI